MIVADFRKKDISALNKALEEERKKLFDYKMKFAIGKEKNVKTGRESRKIIARIMTVIREKELLNV